MFREAFPTYLFMGMSAEEYWHGDPELAVGYRQAWKMRMQSAYLAEWRQGRYVLEALGAVLAKDHQYPEEPLFSVESPEEAEARRSEKGMLRIKEAFLARVEKMKRAAEDDQEAAGCQQRQQSTD